MSRRLPFNLDDRSSPARRIAGAVMGSAGVRVVGMALTFLVGVQLARYLGPAGFGVYGAVMALMALLVVPAQLGLPQLITREISALTARNDASSIKGVLVWFAAIVSGASLLALLMGGIATLLWPNLDSSFREALYWGLASIPLLALLNLAVGAMRGFHHVVGAQIFDALIRPAIFALLLALFAALGPVDAVLALALQALAGLIILVLCAYHLLRIIPKIVLTSSVQRYQQKLTKGATPMLSTEVLRVLDGQYAILLFGMIAALEDVGIFRVAIAAAGFVGLPSTLVNLVIMSFVAQLYAQRDQQRLQLVAAGAAFFMFSIIAPVTLGLFFFGENLIVLVFGKAFAPAWEPLVLISLAYTVNAFFGSVATILNMAGQERVVMTAHLVGPVVGISLTIGLFGTFGVSAAAIAMIVTELIKGTWMTYVARRTLGLNVTLLSVNKLCMRFSFVRTTTSE